jgi:hypothetical protein
MQTPATSLISPFYGADGNLLLRRMRVCRSVHSLTHSDKFLEADTTS